ncbi:Hypothetical protein, putative [Bodo saltans]|uniref:Uncharacterized protein n=1 Tax=Bodo saltans TaxID=75058 RepID=A0A0S4J9X1_BODSA|nr:Hypothetical protein, putative [Bodo saltans]|eukprot:CUG88119.1 Hypothetical protein, putative [Bodo saltans]
MSSGDSISGSSTAHAQHHGATTNAAAGGGSDASRSLTNPSVSFESANFLSVALMSDAVNQSTETSAAAAVATTTAGTTTVLLPPLTATIKPPEATSSSEQQQQQRRRSTRAHQDNGNDDEGLIGPLVPTVSSSYQLLRASHVADSGSVSVLPFDEKHSSSPRQRQRRRRPHRTIGADSVVFLSTSACKSCCRQRICECATLRCTRLWQWHDGKALKRIVKCCLLKHRQGWWWEQWQ